MTEEVNAVITIYDAENYSLKQPSPLLDVPSITINCSNPAGIDDMWPNYSNGYLCPFCGYWVPAGQYHVCPARVPQVDYWYWPPVDEICPDCGEVVERCPTCGKIKKDK